MWVTEAMVCFAFLLHVVTEANQIGYFWHLTDLHWDPKYHNEDNNCLKDGPRVPNGRYGDHSCDSPWALVESAVTNTLQKHGEDIEFILWTGDSVTSNRGVDKMAALTNLTLLMSHVYTSHFVFPVLGHDDPETDVEGEPYHSLSALWRQWLPSEALATFGKGGYYTIERKQTKLRLVALNTNLWTKSDKEEDPGGQWAWLEAVLTKSKTQNESVYLVGHIAPGVDERVGGAPRPSLTAVHNSKYLSLVRRYSDIITGQFFGHLHSDTFRIVYSELGVPVSRMFLSPAITPRRSSAGLNNPGIRLYKIEIDTGQVLDYSQFFLDLQAANSEELESEWLPLYNLTDYYSLQHGSATELHSLVENFTTPEGLKVFSRYLQANSVFGSSLQTNVAGSHTHYCAITRLEYSEFQDCLATAAAPLAASTPPAPASDASTPRCCLSLILLLTAALR